MPKYRACWRIKPDQSDQHFTFNTLEDAEKAIKPLTCTKWIERLDQCEVCKITITTVPATFVPTSPILCNPCNEENMKGLEPQ